MSRQSKNHTRLVAARAMSAQRKSGGGGPRWTEPKHGKSLANRHFSTITRSPPKARPAAR